MPGERTQHATQSQKGVTGNPAEARHATKSQKLSPLGSPARPRTSGQGKIEGFRIDNADRAGSLAAGDSGYDSTVEEDSGVCEKNTPRDL